MTYVEIRRLFARSNEGHGSQSLPTYIHAYKTVDDGEAGATQQNESAVDCEAPWRVLQKEEREGFLSGW